MLAPRGQGCVLVGACPITISTCRAGDAANPLRWAQQEDAPEVRRLFSSSYHISALQSSGHNSYTY